MTHLIALDTETTGLAKAVGSEDFVQLAAVMHSSEDTPNVSIFNELAIPRVPISEGASNTHGHTLETLQGARTSAEVAEEFYRDVSAFVNGEPYVIAAHNFKYDQMILKGHEPLQWLLDHASGIICTRKAAERLMPLIANHQLATVMDACGLTMPGEAHEGMSDAKSCFMLVRHFAKIKGGYKALADWLGSPALLEVMPFSKKWKGVRFEEIDDGFLNWCLKQEDMNEDVKYTAEHHLNKRRGGPTVSVLEEDDIPF